VRVDVFCESWLRPALTSAAPVWRESRPDARFWPPLAASVAPALSCDTPLLRSRRPALRLVVPSLICCAASDASRTPLASVEIPTNIAVAVVCVVVAATASLTWIMACCPRVVARKLLVSLYCTSMRPAVGLSPSTEERLAEKSAGMVTANVYFPSVTPAAAASDPTTTQPRSRPARSSSPTWAPASRVVPSARVTEVSSFTSAMGSASMCLSGAQKAQR